MLQGKCLILVAILFPIVTFADDLELGLKANFTEDYQVVFTLQNVSSKTLYVFRDENIIKWPSFVAKRANDNKRIEIETKRVWTSSGHINHTINPGETRLKKFDLIPLFPTLVKENEESSLLIYWEVSITPLKIGDKYNKSGCHKVFEGEVLFPFVGGIPKIQNQREMTRCKPKGADSIESKEPGLDSQSIFKRFEEVKSFIESNKCDKEPK